MPSSRGMFQRLNPGFLHCRCILYHLSHPGRPLAQKVAPQIALKGCSRGREEGQWIWWKRSTQRALKHIFFTEGYCWSPGTDISLKNFSVFLDMRKYKNWARKISSWTYLSWRPVLPVAPRAQSSPLLISTLSSLWGILKFSSCSSSWFNLCGHRWQVPVCGWHIPQLCLLLKRSPGSLEKDGSGGEAGRCLLSYKHLVPETTDAFTGMGGRAGKRVDVPAWRSIHWPNRGWSEQRQCHQW